MNTPIRIKTFRSKTLQDAFEQIRAEFGPDASILETKSARFGMFGWARIEVTASSSAHEKTSENNPPDADEQTTANLVADSERLSDPASDLSSEHINETSDASSSGSSIPSERTEAAGVCKRDCVLTQLHAELLDAGIDRGIACQWIEAIRETVDPVVAQDIWSLRSEVRGWIRDLVHAVPPLPLDASLQQVIALVGPPGSGKTTALAKIAANYSMEHEGSVGVLSTDTFRLGSNYLLRNYADVLGWKFEIAESVDQVAPCLKKLETCRIVLIDTRGCAPDDLESIEELKQLLATVEPTETHLVIPSTCNSRSFLRYERGFEALSPKRMILTRLDEAGGLGAFFPCLQCSSLPVSYLTNGQNIPADLIQATAMRLAQQIMS